MRKDLGEYVSQAQKGTNNQPPSPPVSNPVPDTDATDTKHHPPSSASSSTRTLRDSVMTDGGESSSTSSSTSAFTTTLLDPQQPQERTRSRSRHPYALRPSPTHLAHHHSRYPPDSRQCAGSISTQRKPALRAPPRAAKSSCVAQVCSSATPCASFHRTRRPLLPRPSPPPLTLALRLRLRQHRWVRILSVPHYLRHAVTLEPGDAPCRSYW